MIDHPRRRDNILIVYGTTEGHTRHLCQFAEHVLAEEGYNVTVCDTAMHPSDPQPYDLCFIAASLHVGNYQSAVLEYVRRYHEVFNSKPAAFLSVSLSAAGENPDDWEGLEQCVERFPPRDGLAAHGHPSCGGSDPLYTV